MLGFSGKAMNQSSMNYYYYYYYYYYYCIIIDNIRNFMALNKLLQKLDLGQMILA